MSSQGWNTTKHPPRHQIIPWVLATVITGRFILPSWFFFAYHPLEHVKYIGHHTATTAAWISADACVQSDHTKAPSWGITGERSTLSSTNISCWLQPCLSAQPCLEDIFAQSNSEGWKGLWNVMGSTLLYSSNPIVGDWDLFSFRMTGEVWRMLPQLKAAAKD